MGTLLTAKETLSTAENIIILAGAGMSADLGVPVYYGGPESKYGNTVSTYGYTAYEHAHAGIWQGDPKSQMLYIRDSWKTLLQIDVTQETSPYQILLEWLNTTGKSYFVATTNVDGAFPRTGYSESKLYEVHGSYRYSQCLNSSHHGVYPTADPEQGYTFCPKCLSYSRPNTLYFDDFAFNDDLTLQQQDNFMRHLQTEKGAGRTVVLEIGAGETVSTLRNFSQEMSMFYKFPVIRLNPDEDTIAFRNTGRAGKPNGEFIHVKEKASKGLNELLSS